MATGMSKTELEARVKQLEAEKAEASRITYKVSPKGAVSVYGLGRFPTTLYKEQWERLFADGDNLLKFIRENSSRLTTKGS